MEEVRINGRTLTSLQRTSLRVALNNFLMELKDEEGRTGFGTELAKAYENNIREVIRLMAPVSNPTLIRIERHKDIEGLPLVAEEQNLDSDQILAKAYGEVESIILAGMDKNGEYYFASSVADGADILWFLEKCKQQLLGNT